MIRVPILFLLFSFIFSRAHAQPPDTFSTRYYLKKGTVLDYHLKIVREYMRFVRGKLRAMGDSLEFDVMVDVINIDSAGTMILNTTLSNMLHGWDGLNVKLALLLFR